MAFRSTDLITLEPPQALAAIRRIGDGYKNFQAVRAAFAGGVFDWLAQHGPAAKAEIASALKLRGAHLGAFLQTLEDLGLLARENGAYSLAPGMSEVLCTPSPWCQAETLSSLLAPSCAWPDMAYFLSENWVPTSMSATAIEHHPLLGEARRLAAHLAARHTESHDAPALRSLLCFDGSDGLLSAALCQRFPEAKATIVVMPDAIPRTQTVIAACGLADRCRVIPGTPLDPPVGEIFDHAVLFHSLYPVRKSTIDALTAVAAHLAPGGALCCAHWFCLEDCETAPGGLRDLDKAVLTDSHPLCHVEAFCQRLEEAGLVATEREDLAGEYGNTKLHFARRPDIR